MKRILYASVLIAFGAASASAANSYVPAPPGSIVQSRAVYLNGEATHSSWHVIASRSMVGRQMGKEPAYQWYLSFYNPAGRLAYQLPNKNNDLLDRVERAHGAEMYYPMQRLRIAGIGAFERPGVQDVVVSSHQAGADCGSADITIFGADSNGRVRQRVHVQNGCRLEAKIVKRGALSAIQLSGPYYGPNAAMCCPTKPHATAILSHAGGKWTVKPSYFTIRT